MADCQKNCQKIFRFETICEESGEDSAEGGCNNRARDAIEDIGFEGWVQIEGAVPPDGRLIESYVTNVAFLRVLFPG